MAKGPYIPWFPADIKADTALQLVSLAAYGLWHKLLYIMHDGEPYGHLSVKGRVIQPVNLANMCGCSVDQLHALLSELELHDIFSRTPEGIIYSRRMVRDNKRAEIARVNGTKGGNPRLRKPRKSAASDGIWDNPQDNQNTKGGDNHSLGSGSGNGNELGFGKEEGTGEKPIRMPHPSDEFRTAWSKWVAHLMAKGWNYPDAQNAQDEIDQLAQYPEEFALELLSKATRSRWRSFVFPDTNATYKKWLSGADVTGDTSPKPHKREALEKGTIQDRQHPPASLRDYLAQTDPEPRSTTP